MQPETQVLRKEVRATLRTRLCGEEGGQVRSAPVRGTNFGLDPPPPPEGMAPLKGPQPDPAGPPPYRETVLVVEDHPAVRAVVVEVLRQAGYTVLAAPHGPEGLEICRQHPGRIDLLITDLVLPQMSGRDVAIAVTALQPNVKVLFMSGYPPADAQPAATGGTFLQKPFTPAVLLEKVQAVLAGQGGSR
jgi:two-component system cell cycle sensor histidine kinase/response regulator CckA